MRRLALLSFLALTLLFVASAEATPPQADFGLSHRPVCAPAGLGFAHCDSQVVVTPDGKPRTTTTPSGYGPASLQSAYNLPSATAGTGQTIAIVDAYDAPTIANDLAVYRAQYKLPDCPVGTCFRKVNQNGVQGSYPAVNASWAQEISLDVDMVSAICPNCNILLVEANSNSFADLGAAVDKAYSMGAKAISNSYGGPEFSLETDPAYASHFSHQGVAITVSSGDSGYGVEFPAASPTVTAVGGTTLTQSKSTGAWSETAWSGAGSGCSRYVSALTWQIHDSCANRTVADVSAVADPNTGVAVYDSTSYQGRSGWMKFGGTSVASPIIASVYGLAGNAASINDGSYPYAHTSALKDVQSGSNGSCGGTYLCTAGLNYDGPTGLGTPNGTDAF